MTHDHFQVSARLFARARAGDGNALTELIDRTTRRLTATVRREFRKLGRDDVDTVVVHSVEEMVRALPRLETPDDAFAYARSAARHEGARVMKRRQHDKIAEEGRERGPPPGPPGYLSFDDLPPELKDLVLAFEATLEPAFRPIFRALAERRGKKIELAVTFGESVRSFGRICAIIRDLFEEFLRKRGLEDLS